MSIIIEAPRELQPLELLDDEPFADAVPMPTGFPPSIDVPKF